MNKEFIPYEQAVSLKELDFDDDCLAFFNEKSKLLGFSNWNVFWNKNSEISYARHIKYLFNRKKANQLLCTAPLYQQVFRWFREKHNLQSFIIVNSDEYSPYSFSINEHDFQNWYSTYEKAELACLIKLIEIVKNK